MPKSLNTFGTIIERHQGVAPGFNTVRLALAALVMFVHSDCTVNGGCTFVEEWPLMWLRVLIIPAFFGLSGFLIAGSMLRLRRVAPFVAFRALRILPALTVETITSAIVSRCRRHSTTAE